ncbi:MAG TPA: hypothetical protein VD866_15265 [Urbifossiella sp.]|nr:hypothetical protein [Urbifossiella sp.]
MNAHSAARAAGLVLLAGLAAGNVGCKHARRAVDACLPPAECNTPCPPAGGNTPCPPDAKPAAPKVVRHHAPAVKCDADCAPSVVEVRRTPPVHVKVPPQDVEVREAPPVHVKVPQQDVVVNLPPQSAPVPPMATMGGMQPVQPMATSGMVPANVSHVPANRARLGFAFDTIRVRLPIIRPIAIPTVPEATFTMPVQPMAVQQQFVQPVAVQQAGFVQPQAVQPVAVQPVAVQQQFVQPQAVQPVAVQPVAPQMQFVQPVAPQQVQLMPVAPMAPPQMQVMPVAPQAPVAPAAPSAQSVDDYCRQVDALMRALEASKRAAGCPPTVLPPR